MARNIEVVVLGSSGGIPTLSRRLPAILLRDWNGLIILLDAGEGVQYALLRRGVSVTRIDVIAVTHAHGDHINGLPGLLQSMYMHERRKPLLLVGPGDVIEFVRDVLRVEGYRLGFEVKLVEVDGEGSLVITERGGDRVMLSWAPACHTVESYAFRLEWVLRPRLDGGLLRRILNGRMEYARILLERGFLALGDRVIRIEDVQVEGPQRLSIVYTGDTAEPCETVLRLSKGARLMIHDATFTSEFAEEAAERGHSTGVQAAQAAVEAGVGVLLLTHISARYEGRAARRILEEALKVFPRVILAWDGLKLSLRV